MNSDLPAFLPQTIHRFFSKMRMQNALVVIGSTLFSLLLAESILRMAWTPWDLKNIHPYGPHPVYGFAPLPGVEGVIYKPEYQFRFRHTLQGWRGETIFETKKKNGKKMILFLGDSFTYGVGSNNEDIFVERLQASWPQIEIANTGCNGYGTRNALAVLDDFGAAFHPDLTVYVFFWNDLSDNLKSETPDFTIDDEGNVKRTDSVPKHGDPLALQSPAQVRKSSAWKTFYLHELLADGLKAARYRWLGMKPPYVHTPAEMENAWLITERLMKIMAQRAQEIGTQLVVVAMPDHNQVNPQARIRNITPDLFGVQDRLRTICGDIPFIDLLPEMREQWEKTKVDYYYYADRHLTPEGNRLAADIMRRHVEEQFSSLLFTLK